ncbi:caspase family protein [Haloprofundus halophilus]|uniref:caspase family protein n=1 Tax=Haloprofundus halophilus TaxID=2283527 RepID=UPI0018E514F0|nr:caspase family protein [Haloprofundus halophilus]
MSTLRCVPLNGRDGIRLVDSIENARFELYTPEPVVPRQAGPSAFCFPVGLAVELRTTSLRLPKLAGVIVRTQDGRTVTQSMNRTGLSLDADAYDVEVTTAPMKLFVAVDDAVSIRYGERSTTFEFDGPTRVYVGARSFHERPAGTVVTPDDPEETMRAVSLLGSALKTTTPERSFPTLRGHPPLVERGETFDAPDRLEAPETGVTLVLPPERSAVYASAPLAYYLGATVVPGSEARLDVAGRSFPLAPDGDVERELGRTLRQVFFLDCLTRTEGYYPVDLHERHAVETAFDVAFASLYELPLDEQLAEYLSMPFEDLEPYLPAWNLTTDVRPTAENVEMLPFVANDLSLVRCPDRLSLTPPEPEPRAVTDFFRRATRAPAANGASETLVRGASDAAETEEIVHPRPADTVEHAWVGEGFPLGASKATAASYRRRLERDVSGRTSIDITVVCNDEQMREEGVVAELYGLRDLLQFEIDIRYDLTREELTEVLSRPTNFLHYIGHVDHRGMQCVDGFLDAQELDDVAVESFLLNACSSYKQGEALVERGSYGGVVTLSDVTNTTATKLGQTLARLLNCGFTLRSALTIAQQEVFTANRYIVLGDGGLSLCQNESGVPSVLHLDHKQADDTYEIEIEYYPAKAYDLGSLAKPLISATDKYYLATGSIGKFEVSADETERFLRMERAPVKINGSLRWSDEFCTNRDE